MKMTFGAKTYLSSFLVLAIALLGACAAPALPATSPSDEPQISQTTPPVNEPSAAPATSSTPDETSGAPDRVDVVYFHRPQRCPTCLCFEERVRYVMSTYFQTELNSGKVTFGVYNIGDSQNADIVKKYGPISSQLFINAVKGESEDIRDIQEIWDWSCRSDKPGFDQKVKNVIEQTLNGEQ
jgi:hypothetical protein